MNMECVSIVFSFKRLYLFLERGKEGERRERNIDVWEIHWSVASHTPQWRTWPQGSVPWPYQKQGWLVVLIVQVFHCLWKLVFYSLWCYYKWNFFVVFRLLFVCRNAIDFCLLTLYLTILLHLFVQFCLCGFFKSFWYIRLYHLWTRIILLLHFQFACFLFYCVA